MSRPIRRTNTEMNTIRDGLLEILREDHPQTVRGVFYQAVSRGLVRKTEQEYKGTVCRLLTELRRSFDLPYSYLADGTRWMRKPSTHAGLQQALEDCAAYYRRDLWQDQRDYVEVWVEKDALAGVLYKETEVFDVPLMATRGFASLSFLHGAGEAIRTQGKPAYIYYFGDYDPSGLVIGEKVEEGLREFAGGDVEIIFSRMAVTEEQITLYDLPTRPTKQSDSRAKSFGKGDSVELDALPAKVLRQMVREAIAQHIDQDALARTRMLEQAEAETLNNILEQLPELMAEN